MAVTASSLRTLHRIHRQLADLRARRERGPQQILARKANLEQLENERSQKKSEVQAARISGDDKQVELKRGEAKVADLKIKLNACSSNKEYQALLEQIEAAEMAGSVLSDEILETWEQIEELDNEVAEMDQRLDATRVEFTAAEQRVREERQAIDQEMARLEGELIDVEKQLPADFKNDYDRVVGAKGDDGMAAVDGEACGGCFQHLTPNTLNELYLAHPVFCKSCGRLLYLPEDREPTGRG